MSEDEDENPENDEGPQDPISSLRVASVSLHELYVSLVNAGFTRWQACVIVGVLMAEQSRQE